MSSLKREDRGRPPGLREYTHPSVLEGIRQGADWADPVLDPREIDWAARQARAAIPFKVIDGRPVNPCESTGIRYGRNEFGHWGEALMADALVATVFDGTRYLLMVERDDGNGWAVPGGYVEPGESSVRAALRELAEETGLRAAQSAVALPARYVPDPRASDEAWAVTVPVVVQLGHNPPPAVHGADDARRAAWVPARSYTALEAYVDTALGGQVFAAHKDMLADFLNGVSR